MKQYIDKSALVAEIDRLQKPTMDANHNFTSDYNQGFYDGLSQLELFIESLSEEKKPIREYVSPEDSTLGKLLKEAMEELEEKIALYEKNHKKSVSDDLEEVSRNYADNEEYGDDVYYAIKAAFKEGANWQKEQIMGAAIKGIARPLDYEVWCDRDEFPQNIQDGDKVKLIIFKEE